MDEKEFNLIDEPWIKVRTPTLTVKTVSLQEALLHAHTYVDLAGELPTQDVAVLRLLLAVLHAVFSRVDCGGNPAPIQKPEQALLRWKELWENGKFPEKPICDYLEQWHERFWLFHPERPFYQVGTAETGTAYSAAKLNGELSESTNKVRLFPARADTQKGMLTYAEAARWLLYVNGFDDTSSKPKGKGLPSVGAGWLGKIGLISAMGDNLFETLLLNLVLLKEKNEIWGKNRPTWELDVPRQAERTIIPLPDNQAELLTMQSRRILLKKAEDFVEGYSLLGGDVFPAEDAFTEQMTLWRPYEEHRRTGFRPQRHRAEKYIWQEFSSLLYRGEEGCRPGVITWIATLKKARCLDTKRWISFKTASVQYGDKDFFAADVLGDQITFHMNLITETGAVWQRLIERETARIDKLASAVGELAGDLEKAAGHVEQDSKGNVVPSRAMDCAKKARELYYHKIDVPFREWLRKLDPAQSDVERDKLRDEWIDTAKQIALDMGEELVKDAGDAAMLGRFIEEKKGSKVKRHYSAPEAFIVFKHSINRICIKEG